MNGDGDGDDDDNDDNDDDDDHHHSYSTLTVVVTLPLLYQNCWETVGKLLRFSQKMLCPRLPHPQKRMTSPNAGPSKNRTGQPSVNKNLRVHGKIIASKNTTPEKQPPPSPEKQPQPPMIQCSP